MRPVTPLPATELKSLNGSGATIVARPRRTACAKRMRRSLLERRRDAQEPLARYAFNGHHVGHRGLALGQRAGLVDDQCAQAPGVLERGRVADQHARLRATSGADHDRGRRGQPERAGTGDDQHRDRVDQRRAPRRSATTTHDEGHQRNGEDDRHEDARDAVGEALDRRLRSLRFRDQAHDAGEHGRVADAGRLAREHAVLIERAGIDPVADGFADTRGSRRSACSRRRSALPARTTPSTGNALAGAHEKRSPVTTLGERHVDGPRRRARRAPRSAAVAASPCSAADVPILARASSSLPSSTSVITAAPASK